MRRALLPWLIALGGLVLVGAAAVVVLNATVFGAGGFVQVYLGALARHDLTGALSLPGVEGGDALRGQEAALLREGTLGGLGGLHQTADAERGGHHFVTVAWTTSGGAGSTTFEVERIGTRFGLFPEWGFAVSPTATVSLTVEHDARFTVNGVQATTATAGTAQPYTVLVPGAYRFAHTSLYLTAPTDAVLADTIGQTLTATVDVRANPRFVRTVQQAVDTQLTSCATQTVLFPTGCAFGQSITNRVSSTPAWSIVHPPVIALEPGSVAGTWVIPPSPATAHLTVQVTSLFDGSTSTFDQDVPFLVQADVTLGAGDRISIVQR